MAERYTRKLAEYLTALSYEDLPEATVRMTKACILDWLGVAMRGSQEQPAKLLRRQVARPEDATGEATVLDVKTGRASAMNAAFCNGAASHTLDFDDLHNPSIVHIATVVIPAAFAVAEREKKSGKELLAAVAGGYELTARVGESVMPESYYYWHTTGTTGTFGAAAAAGMLLGLNADEMNNALGNAGTQSAGLWEFVAEGAMSKPLHTGKSAYGGVLAAYLAKDGFTGAQNILEGPKGFCRAMTTVPHFEKLTEGLGQSFKIDENSFKPYPCCKHSHAAIYAAQTLCKDEAIASEDIDEVIIRCNSIVDSLINNPDPKTPYGGKFSIQYCVAEVILRGQVSLESFSPEELTNTELRTFMERVKVIFDDEIQKIYEADHSKLVSKVIIKLKNGRSVEMLVEYPKGDPENPMSWEESVSKFKSLTEPIWGEKTAGNLVALIDGLEKVECFAAAFPAAFE